MTDGECQGREGSGTSREDDQAEEKGDEVWAQKESLWENECIFKLIFQRTRDIFLGMDPLSAMGLRVSIRYTQLRGVMQFREILIFVDVKA